MALGRQREIQARNSSSLKGARGKESERKASALRKGFLTPTRVFQTEWEELRALIQSVLAGSDNRLS